MQKNKPEKELDAQQFWQRLNELIGSAEPFAWAKQQGITKSTFQSSRERGTRPLSRTVKVWAEQIGCNYEWLMEGVGTPFGVATAKGFRHQTEQERLEDNETRAQTQARWDITNQKKLDVMSAERAREDKARHVESDRNQYETPIAPIFEPNPEVLELAISTLYEALAATKKSMPPAAQTKMILNLYSLFSTSQQGDNIKNYVLELIRSLGATTEIEA